MEEIIEETIKHIYFLARHLSGCEDKHVVSVFLLELGICTRGIGFEYLKQAILLQNEDPARTMTKHIYPDIARYNGAPGRPGQIERSIDRLIEKSWKKRNNRIWRRYFPPGEDGQVPRPSNGEFICTMAQVLDIWKGCRDAYLREQQEAAMLDISEK